ncbi:MAG: polysaccharide biosynthesis C-terminal domain-containing protein [Bacteroidales bacterium]|nr:polysaccharide biosynthesis C-terminal domain-containing protein [Bacteroidales bacterium]
MDSIKNLAGQTAIYGISSILGRLLNYMLVPLYSRVFLPEEAAVYVEMYAYVAFFIVILTYGMETAFFRFNEKEKNNTQVYSTTLIGIFFSTALFIGTAIALAGPIAGMLRYPTHPEYIIYFALIIGLDAFTSIPFAKLRAEKKAMRFATIKLINIGVNIGLNLFLLIFVPYAYNTFSWGPYIFGAISSGEPIIGHIFVANLAASAIVFLLLTPDFLKIRFQFNVALWKKMFRYAFPLLILGLAGVANETIDRVLLKYILPEETANYQLGIYGMVFKIAIVMSIFIQAFRYAAEPFFFAMEKEKDSRKVYADVMKYFVILMTFLFLAIMLYMNLVKYFVGENFYSGLKVVPILLYSHVFLGIFYNLSIWYKLSGQTRFGAYISIIGTSISVGLNIILIPKIGYMGSAWANFACYAVMMVISYILGQKYYKVHYDMLRIFIYMGLSAGLWYISVLFAQHLMPNETNMQMAFNTILLIIFIIVIFVSEPRLKLMVKNIGSKRN